MQTCYKVTRYKAHQLQSLRNVKMHSPCIIQIQSGSKRLYTKKKVTSLSPSTYLLCRAGESLSFENAPLAGYFQSNVYSFYFVPDEELLRISRTQQLHSISAVVERSSSIDITLASLSGYDLSKLSIASQTIAVKLLYQQLAELGVLHYLFPEQKLNFSSRVANYISLSPEKGNAIEDVAAEFGVSRATFIRRLAKEGSRYRDLLVEVRLSTALSLMQEGVDDLQLLAHRCGYASATRFNQRFKATFGLAIKDYIDSVKLNRG